VNDLVALGVVIAIEPLPIIAFIIVLSTERGVRNGWAFIVGWLVCLAAIVVATLALTGGKPPEPSTAPATFTFVLELLIGIALLGIAVHFQRLDPNRPRKDPSWTKRVDQMGPLGAATLGILIQPWGLVAAAAASVAQADLSQTSDVVQIILFTLIATSGLLAMETYTIVAKETAGEKLAALRTWLDTHRDRAIVILSAVVGLYLIGKGVYYLVTTT
jgi:hypothetical protein